VVEFGRERETDLTYGERDWRQIRPTFATYDVYGPSPSRCCRDTGSRHDVSLIFRAVRVAYECVRGLIHVCIRSEGSPRRECRRAITASAYRARQPKARTLARADAADESSRTYAGGKPASSLSSCVDAPSRIRASPATKTHA